MGYNKRVAAKKPFLKEAHMEKRLQFAKAHRNWIIEQWKQVVWTDESSVEIGKDILQKKVWRLPQEKYDKDCLKPSFKSGRTSFMVWGAICGRNKSELVFLPKDRRTSQDFVDLVYKPVLLGFLQSNPGSVLMEDNASIHTAKAAKEWRDLNGVEKIEWPAQSPDPNPIENVWSEMKRRFHQDWSRLKGQKTNEEMLVDAWNSITVEYLDKTVSSMPSRMKKVIAAKGGSIDS